MPSPADSLFAQLTGLTSDTRLYELRLADVGAPLAVEGFVMREELSTLFELDLLVLSPSIDLEDSHFIHSQGERRRR